MKRIFKNIIVLASLSSLMMTGCGKENLPSVNSPIDKDSNIYGVVTDSEGNFLKGVTVSDGYTCCVTDANGVYQLKSGEFSYHVFVSVPSDCKVPVVDGQPCFWKQLSADTQRYDFQLEKCAVEENFNLFCLADPQCQNNTHIGRYTSETIPDIAAEVEASTLPVYGMVLGDIGYNTANNDYTNATFPLMKKALSSDNYKGMPFFKVMGNHDNKVISVKAADYTVAHDIRAQRNFEIAFGPINYSFNRGKVHFIGMDDMIFPNHNDYSLGFRDDQVEWLRQDLENVPKDNLIILCVHVPMRNENKQNVQAVLELLQGYAGLHIMSGHTHYAENDEYENRYEHVHGAACGAWWNSTINTDGTPNGYAIYRIEGTKVASWRYKATGKDNSYQIRLYRGKDRFFEGAKLSYQSVYNGENDLIANIWNADSQWKVEIFENGTKTGEMLPYGSEADGKKRDPWASGYHRGILDKGEQYDRTANSHMFHGTLQNPNADIRVVATDRFGNTYEQTYITVNTPLDYPKY